MNRDKALAWSKPSLSIGFYRNIGKARGHIHDSFPFANFGTFFFFLWIFKVCMFGQRDLYFTDYFLCYNIHSDCYRIVVKCKAELDFRRWRFLYYSYRFALMKLRTPNHWLFSWTISERMKLLKIFIIFDYGFLLLLLLLVNLVYYWVEPLKLLR